MSDRPALSEIALGPSAIEYIRSRLQHGHGFAAALCLRLARFRERATTWVPPGLPMSAVEDFRTGGKITKGAAAAPPTRSGVSPVLTAYSVLADLAEEHLREPGYPAVVFEDANAARGDPYLARQKSRLAYFGDEVLHLLLRGDSRASIEFAIRESRSVPTFVAAFTEVLSSAPLGVELTEPELNELADATTVIVVGAYDGEGFVALRRSDDGPHSRRGTRSRAPNA